MHRHLSCLIATLVASAILLTSPIAQANHYILCNRGKCDPPPPPIESPAPPPAGRVEPEAYYALTQSSLPDGRWLTAGGARLSGYGYVWFVARWLALPTEQGEGTLDGTFGIGGVALLPVWGDYEFADALVVQPDGSVIVGGNAHDPTVPSSPIACYPAFCNVYPAVQKLRSDGTPDLTFNGTGKIVIAVGHVNVSEDVGRYGYLTALQLEADGSALVVSETDPIARILSDGTLDPSFRGPGPAPRAYGEEIVVEYYDAALDHYFITWLTREQDALDRAYPPSGWRRTGETRNFKTWRPGWPDTVPVCRFYLPPGSGDSHFFGRGPQECEATARAHPEYVLEDPAFMGMKLPVDGRCVAHTVPVYRLFDGRMDPNHRYTTDPAVRDDMVAKGWIAEGDGDDRVAMCAPR